MIKLQPRTDLGSAAQIRSASNGSTYPESPLYFIVIEEGNKIATMDAGNIIEDANLMMDIFQHCTFDRIKLMAELSGQRFYDYTHARPMYKQIMLTISNFTDGFLTEDEYMPLL